MDSMRNSFERLSEKENAAFESFVITEHLQNIFFIVQVILILGFNALLIGLKEFLKPYGPKNVEIKLYVMGALFAIFISFQFTNIIKSGCLALSYLQIIAPENIKEYDPALHEVLAEIQESGKVEENKTPEEENQNGDENKTPEEENQNGDKDRELNQNQLEPEAQPETGAQPT
ncbi:hypothetical protein ECANGB1_2383 [Enterospora canceri]|uniref:Uncharacterized protein n=1 Tax=Enterospora canceri TaxID=1081671 RepID=A0A1Y1S3Q0_9MICR|nr:hypothetical protein ECANGB1_2383 [Enterospora canceri]